MNEIIDEMRQHVKLAVEYQTLIARCAPQSQAAHELKVLIINMMSWIKAAKAGAADIYDGLRLCLEDETQAFELARWTLYPYRDWPMEVWFEVYCDRLAASD